MKKQNITKRKRLFAFCLILIFFCNFFAFPVADALVVSFFEEATTIELEHKNTKIGSAFFSLQSHLPNGELNPDFVNAASSKSVNTFMLPVYGGVGDTLLNKEQFKTALKIAKAGNCQVFAMLGHYILKANPNGNGVVPVDGYQQRLQAVVVAAQEADAYETLAGFYLDEPFCYESDPDFPNDASKATPTQYSLTMDSFNQITRYNYENIGKRFFILVNAVSFDYTLDNWLTPYKHTPQVSPEMTQYITDIGIDMYGDWSNSAFQNAYRSGYATFKQKIGTQECARLKFWHTPSFFNNWILNNERGNINHLNGMKEMLDAETNKGGLIYYYWGPMHGTDGLPVGQPDDGYLQNTVVECGKTQVTKTVNPWTNYLARLNEIGESYVIQKMCYEGYSARSSDVAHLYSYGTPPIMTIISGTDAIGTPFGRGLKITGSENWDSNIFCLKKNASDDFSNVAGVAVWIKNNHDMSLGNIGLRNSADQPMTEIYAPNVNMPMINANSGQWIYFDKSFFNDNTNWQAWLMEERPGFCITSGTDTNDDTSLEVVIGGIFLYEDKSDFIEKYDVACKIVNYIVSTEGTNSIVGVSPNSNLTTFMQNISGTNVTFSATNSNLEPVGTGLVGTGTKLKAYSPKLTLVKTYTVIIYGEVDGDGLINIADLTAIKRHLLKIATLEGYNLSAAKMNKGSAVTIYDLLTIKKHILGIKSIEQK